MTDTSHDPTPWLNSNVPAGVIEGVEDQTVRELILGALRSRPLTILGL